MGHKMKYKLKPHGPEDFMLWYDDINRMIVSYTKNWQTIFDIKTKGLEAVIAYNSAIKSYKEGSEVSFNNWLFKNVTARIITSVKKDYYYESKVFYFDDLPTGSDFLSYSLDDFDDDQYLEKLTENLTQRELVILVMVHDGFTYKQIGKSLWCTTQNIAIIFNKALAKITEKRLQYETV